ncbi:MAG: CocE/NonD family hydrolase, partial [Woeseia sp.]
ALKAVIPVDATEDLYQDDVHYMDGIMHVDSWEMSQDLYNAMPGAPDYVIDDDYFRDRFDTEPWMLTYKNQQRDGPFWDRASTRDRYDEIRVPSFHIGGWYDGYRDSVPRMLENVDAPVKGMVGPWSHAFPHEPWPNPGMEWRHEAVRWFDHWLKGIDTGIMDEPAFAVYVRDWHPPNSALDFIEGRWRWEDGWPLARTEHRTYYAQPNHDLSAGATDPATHQLRYVPSTGVEAGGPVMWWGDLAHDQRPTDAFSLVYDSAPLEDDVEILGFPEALLTVSANAPHANWYVRLSDVAPDGRVTLVTGAGFNGTHRKSAREPEPLAAGEPFKLDVEMHFTSWTFPAGHRIRMSVSNAQWPMFWPTPYPMTSTLKLGGDDGSRLRLPVIPPGPETAPDFRPPADSPSLPGYRTIDSGNASGYGEISAVTRHPPTGEAIAVATNSGGTEYPWGIETYRETIEHRTSDVTPLQTSMTGTHEIEVTMDDRVLRWEAVLDFTSDAENFHYRYTRRLIENDELVREKHWDRTIPRDFQ